MNVTNAWISIDSWLAVGSWLYECLRQVELFGFWEYFFFWNGCCCMKDSDEKAWLAIPLFRFVSKHCYLWIGPRRGCP